MRLEKQSSRCQNKTLLTSNKAKMTVTAATASDSLSVRTSILYLSYPNMVVPVFDWLCLSGLPQLFTSTPGPSLMVVFG